METITIKDIARMCGVGVSTVSRAMNNHPDINEETKQKVMDIIKEYNYIPNNSARNLKLSESNSIAILVKGISNPFFMKMIKVMEKEIQKKKYALVLHHVEMNEDEVDVALESSIFAFSAASFSLCRAIGSFFKSIPVSDLN